MIEVFLEPALKDNYIAIVRETVSGRILIVDPTQAMPAMNFLSAHNWRPDLILNTHHHWDHVSGNDELIGAYNCFVYAPNVDAKKIHGVNRVLEDGERFQFGDEFVQAIHIPGHTLGHTAYYFEKSKVVFAGDTLFSLGCGRLFEGTAEQMWRSLRRLMQLPDETKVYCGHEYTLSNAKFALTIEPDNFELRRRETQAKALREKGLPTLPTTIGLEKATNPFLRFAHPNVRKTLGMENDRDVDVFARLRAMKDTFNA